MPVPWRQELRAPPGPPVTFRRVRAARLSARPRRPVTAPSVRVAARENRAFLGRAVRYLAAEAGLRQFLDIGAGLPATGNVHHVAQAIAPSCRVVYADNDPLILTHARALLTPGPAGRTAYIHADLRDPAAILADPVTRAVLDFGQPIALVLVAVLHFIHDDDQPAQMLVPPGVVLVSDWRPADAGPRPAPGEVNCYGGVARITTSRAGHGGPERSAPRRWPSARRPSGN